MPMNKSKEEKRKRKTELQRIRRLKIKNDPEAYERNKAKERERWKERVLKGKVKTIGVLSRRDKKVKRALWVKSSKKYREKIKNRKADEIRFMEETTPPPSPTLLRDRPSTSRQNVGRNRVRRDRAKAYRTISKLKTQLDIIQKQSFKYKAKYYRLKKAVSKKSNTPNSKVNNMLRNYHVPQEVKKKLLFHEVLTTQIANNLKNITQRKDRGQVRRILTGDIVKKYKLLGNVKFLSYKEQQQIISKRCKTKSNNKIKIEELRKKVKEFFERDESSRVCPGKNDTITRNCVKKQKRLLNKPLKSLHKDFMVEYNCRISYSLFCQLRPFWVVFANINKRDTCLCTICENNELLVKKMKILQIIEQNTAEMLYKSICCEKCSEQCLERKCPNCANLKITFNEYVPEDQAMYWKWLTKTEVVVISGKEKECKKVVKTKIICTKKEMADALVSNFESFMQHIANRNHQYQTVDALKKQLKPNEVLLHMDFSENYVCKYNREIQSMHFGGSKEQAVLHTLVAYYNVEGEVVHQSYCTISECPRKDPIAILAHLKPVFNALIYFVPNLTKMHFLSDGPSTQYRNYKLFYLFGVEFPKFLPNTLNTLTWNYSETGHGKGAPDGIGGCVKRTADSLVSLGKDIPNVSTLVDSLKDNIKTNIIYVSSDDVNNLNTLLPEKLNRFKGTLRTHQITWAKNDNQIHFRRLTCNVCEESQVCEHYELGTLPVGLKNQKHRRLRYSDVYGSSDSGEENENQPLSIYQQRTFSEKEDDKENQPCLNKNSKNITVGAYLLIRFMGKKSIRHYIGQVMNIEENDSFEVKYLRKFQNTCFVFPDIDDIWTVERCDIEEILDYPIIDKRGHHYFNTFLFNKYKYLS